MSIKQQMLAFENKLDDFEAVFSLIERNETNKHRYDEARRKLNIMRKVVNERRNGTLTIEKNDYYRKQFDAK